VVEAETGFTLDQWNDAYAEIWNIGSQLDGNVKILERSELVRSMASRLTWNDDRVSEIVNFLSLTPRDDFLSPAAPYRQVDVYPWRFGRPLSYIRRPLIVVPSQDRGADMILWGNRHLLHSEVYFAGLFFSGRYKASSEELKVLNGRLNKRRGDEFNDAVASIFQSIPGLVVKSRVRKIKGRPLGSIGEHGDIDVLIAEPTHHRIRVVECNDLAAGRAPHELSNELQSLFKGTETQKSKVEKLLDRTAWVSKNLSQVLEELGVDPVQHWSVEREHYVILTGRG
jgi:hypothetical protein